MCQSTTDDRCSVWLRMSNQNSLFVVRQNDFCLSVVDIFDAEQLEEAGTIHEVYPRRLKASQVHVELKNGQHYFPLATGELTHVHAL